MRIMSSAWHLDDLEVPNFSESRYLSPSTDLQTFRSRQIFRYSFQMLFPLLFLGLWTFTVLAHFTVPNDDQDMSDLVVNNIPYSIRVKYMRLVGLSFDTYFPHSSYSNRILSWWFFPDICFLTQGHLHILGQ